MWSIYLLKSKTDNRTYIGATTDVDTRLRQHNGEIKGGARSTRGRKWELVCWVTGFKDRSEAYRWEKLAKLRGGRGVDQRLLTLEQIAAGNCPGRLTKKYYKPPTGLFFYRKAEAFDSFRFNVGDSIPLPALWTEGLDRGSTIGLKQIVMYRMVSRDRETGMIVLAP